VTYLRLGWACYFARQYDQAIEQFLKTPIAVEEENYQVFWRLGLVYLQKSMYEEAISKIKRAEALSGGHPLTKASLAYAYVKSGRRAEAETILEELNSLLKQEAAPSVTMAATYASLGLNDRAFEWLERAYQLHENRVIHINVEPMLDVLRSDSRFEALSRRVGLAQ
jgi:tetratricopeptide (TPR) repeat protein